MEPVGRGSIVGTQPLQKGSWEVLEGFKSMKRTRKGFRFGLGFRV